MSLSGDIFERYRSWESKDGRELEARVVSIDADSETVRMKRRDGASFTIDWQRFAKAEQSLLSAAALQLQKAGQTNLPEDKPEASPIHQEVELPNKFELKDVPMVTQKGAFCVPASATMVAGYHGVETDQDEVARLSSEDSLSHQGTNPADMLLAMNKIGFGGRSVYWRNEDDFFSKILPTIRRELVETGPIYISFGAGVFGSMGHGCVIVGYNHRREELYFHNPWGNWFKKEYEDVASQGRGIVLITPPRSAPIASEAFIETVKKSVPKFEGNFLKLAARLDRSGQSSELIWCSRRDARDDKRFARDTARDDGRKILELAFERNPAVLIPYSKQGETTKYFFVTRPPEGGARFLVRAIDANGWNEPEMYTLGSLTRNWATQFETESKTEKIWELPMIELHPPAEL